MEVTVNYKYTVFADDVPKTGVVILEVASNTEPLIFTAAKTYLASKNVPSPLGLEIKVLKING